ncbi:MAG TPA: hypothetical protein VF510_00030, partial [Ktedonobacterales bacterium]
PSVRPLADAERHTMGRGLHSSDIFVLRRRSILLARGTSMPDYRGANGEVGEDSRTTGRKGK